MVMVNTDFIGTIADDEEVPVDESSESEDDVGCYHIFIVFFLFPVSCLYLSV